MLNNLLDTWSILSPEEYITYRDNEFPSIDFSIIINCITKRGYNFNINTSGSNPLNIDCAIKDINHTYSMQLTDIPTNKNIIDNINSCLLFSYLSTLAATREPYSGTWKHYKQGDLYTVKSIADTRELTDTTTTKPIVGCYTVEENTKYSVNLIGNKYSYYYEIDNTEISLVPRVFYEGDSGKWARLVDDFLGLTDGGKLRFTKVAN